MKSIFITTILLLSALFSNAQNDKTIRYKQLISDAESHHHNQQFKMSDSLYNAAFSIKEIPLYRDLIEAMMNAIKADEKSSFFLYAQMFSEKYGAPAIFFTTQGQFDKWQTTGEWAKLIENSQVNEQLFYAKNRKIIDEIDSLYNIADHYMKYLFTEDYTEEYMNLKSSETIEHLYNLFLNYGYLAEHMTGLNYRNGQDIIDPKLFKILEFGTFIIRNGEVESQVLTDFDSYFNEAYKNGHITEKQFNHLKSMSSKNGE